MGDTHQSQNPICLALTIPKAGEPMHCGHLYDERKKIVNDGVEEFVRHHAPRPKERKKDVGRECKTWPLGRSGHISLNSHVSDALHLIVDEKLGCHHDKS